MVKKLVCTFCASRCGALLQMEEGRITGVQGDPGHPVSRGWTCRRGRAHTVRKYREALPRGE